MVDFIRVFLNFLKALDKYCHHAVVLLVYGASSQCGGQLAERDDRHGDPKVLGNIDANRAVGHTRFSTRKVLNAHQFLV